MNKNKMVREPLILPLQPEERLRRLREIFEKQCKEHEGKASNFFMKQMHKLAPDVDEILLETKEKMWSYWVRNEGGIDHFGSFFCRAMLNTGLDWLKKRRNRPTVPLYWSDSDGDEQSFEIAAPTAPIEDPYSTLEKALKALPEAYREVIVLRADEQSYDEIAEALQLPIGTVKSRLCRGKILLFNELVALGLNTDFVYENVQLGFLTEEPEEEEMSIPNAFTNRPGSPFNTLGHFAGYFVRAAKAEDGSLIAYNTAYTILTVPFGTRDPHLSARNRIRAHRAIELRLKELNRRDDIPEWQKIFDEMTQVPSSRTLVQKRTPEPLAAKDGETFFTEAHSPFNDADIFAKAMATIQGNLELAEFAKLALTKGFEEKVITRHVRDLSHEAIRRKLNGQDQGVITYWSGRFDSYIPNTVDEDPIEVPKVRVIPNAQRPVPPKQSLGFIEEALETEDQRAVATAVAAAPPEEQSLNGQRQKRTYTRRTKEETPEVQVQPPVVRQQQATTALRREVPVVTESHVLRGLEKHAGGGAYRKDGTTQRDVPIRFRYDPLRVCQRLHRERDRTSRRRAPCGAHQSVNLPRLCGSKVRTALSFGVRRSFLFLLRLDKRYIFI